MHIVLRHVLVVFTILAPRADAGGVEPFGRAAYLAPEGMLWTKWRTVQTEIAREAGLIDACRTRPADCESHAAVRYLALLVRGQAATARMRLAEINRAVNGALVFASDFEAFGREDHWGPPLQSLAAGRGDCEESAILKYAILSDIGWPQDDLRMVLVRDIRQRTHHMVAAAREAGRWFILDNRSDDLVEDVTLPQLVPAFILDRRGVLQIGPPSPPDGFRLRPEVGCSGLSPG